MADPRPIAQLELLAGFILLALVAAMAMIAALERMGRFGRPARMVDADRGPIVIAAASSLAASAIHFAVVGVHVAEYPPFGAAFEVLGWFQAGWAVFYLRHPDARLAAVGAVVNLGTIAVWATSRAVGLPVGPTPWQPEAIGVADLVATILEGALLVLLARVHVPAWSARVRHRISPTDALGAQTGGLIAILVLSWAAIATPGHVDDHQPESLDVGSRIPARLAPQTAPVAPASPGAPSRIVFGTGIDPTTGEIVGLLAHVRAGEVVAWSAPIPTALATGMRLVVIDPIDGAILHEEAATRPIDGHATGSGDLGRLTGAPHGLFELRYVARDGKVLARALFALEHAD